MKHSTIFGIALSLFLLHSVAFAQDNTYVTIKDFMALDRIGQPQFSPDGNQVMFTVGVKKSWDSKNKVDIRFWNAKSNDTKIVSSEKSYRNASWSPDGSKIGFTANIEDAPQVYAMSKGGEPAAITNERKGVRDFRWIGNNAVAYTLKEPISKNVKDFKKRTGGAKKVGTKISRSSLWIKSFDKDKAIKVTNGNFHVHEYDVSSDGKLFATVTSNDASLFNYLSESKFELIADNGKRLFQFNEGTVFAHPTFSPDNKRVAFIGCTTGYSSNNALFVLDVERQKIINLTKEFDPTIEQIEWLDNNTIAFLTPRNTASGIYKVHVKKGNIETLVPPHYVIWSFAVSPNGKSIAYTASSGSEPTELMVMNVGSDPKSARAITSVNQDIKQKKLAKTMVIQYKSFDQTPIEAVVTLPADYKEGNKYPLMVLPHGGPDGIVKNNLGKIAQVFAARNYMVLEPNFRGSIGYGSTHYAGNRADLGGGDYQDIMIGVDHLIEKGMVDADKMVVGGWSYGGYMTNWIVGHTNRFKAAVSVAGIANTVSMYAQSDINHGKIAQWEFKGVPVTNMENYERSSPIKFMKNCKTPTLILHGEADSRVPVAQAWEMYRALEDLGIDHGMILYPGAGHGISNPKQHVNVFEEWIAWYEKYLNN